MNTRTILRHNNSEKRLIINSVNYIDIDKYRDELIKLKQELNKRNKEYQDLKVEYLKLAKQWLSTIIDYIDIVDTNVSADVLYARTLKFAEKRFIWFNSAHFIIN